MIQKLKNLRLATKLVLIAIIPIIAMIVITFTSSRSIETIYNNMENKIKKQNYEAISLVLNSDRDFYQAFLAVKLLVYEGQNKADQKKFKEEVLSNINDVETRIKEARGKIPQNDIYWRKFVDKEGHTITNNFNDFEANFTKWKQNVLNSITTGKINTNDELFEIARGKLNIIGEMIDKATVDIVNINKNEKNAVFRNLIIVDVTILIIISILLYIVILNIARPVKELTFAAEKISIGDCDIDLKIESKDEISKLKLVFMKMVEDIKLKAKVAQEISNGNLTSDIIIRSDKDILSKSMEQLKNTLLLMVHDTNLLTEEALKGNLSFRADSAKHNGEFKKIIEGINSTLDAIVNPINDVSNVMEKISGGLLNTHIDKEYKGDYAKLVNSVNSTVIKLKSVISELANVLQHISQGNLNIDLVRTYEGDFGIISKSINNIIISLNDILGDVIKTSNQVSIGSRQVSEGSMQLSQGATEQASSIQELSSSMSLISEQTKSNAENASKANQLALEAKMIADTGNNQMKDMLKAMEEINVASENISKIIKVIDEIAFQTNILSLNAAVEAARAGIHGKGFAVVAEQVGNLAARSAEAAKETTEYIEASIKKVHGGTKIVNETANSLLGIVSSSSQVADLVNEIAIASKNQATGILQINVGIDQVSKVIQSNSATAQESAAASTSLNDQINNLNKNISRFKLRLIKREPESNNEYDFTSNSPDRQYDRSDLISSIDIQSQNNNLQKLETFGIDFNCSNIKNSYGELKNNKKSKNGKHKKKKDIILKNNTIDKDFGKY